MASHVADTLWPWQKNQGFPWPSVQFYCSDTPFITHTGAAIEPWQLAYEEWGPKSGQPVVIFHALTGDSHVASHHPEEVPGWWEGILGAGKALDSERHHVLCFNVLGGAMGSTGPSSLDADGRPLGSRFPSLSLFDMARAARQLIKVWHPEPIRIIGGSMGGMLAYAYGSLYPDDVDAILAIGAPIQHEPWAIAYHTIGRTAIEKDPHFENGDYYGGPYPASGLSIARMADMISYQHPDAMAEKFGRRLQLPEAEKFQVQSYLHYQGHKLINRFDANTYLVLTKAMDEFWLSRSHMDALRHTPIWMIGIESDLLYLPKEIERHALTLQQAGVSVHLDWLSGPWGHDTFLVEQDRMGHLISQFLRDSE